jgi:hypothetical protein
LIFCSIARGPQLPQALVLARSLKRHHPDSKFVLVLLERSMHLAAKYSAFVDEVWLPEELQVKEWDARLFSYRSLDAAAAFKGALLKYLLEEKTKNGDIIVYIDPNVYALGPFDELAAEAANSSILLVPHLLEPTTEKKLERELVILCDGLFHSGLIALKNNKEARRFASWWTDLVMHSFNDLTEGYYMDQKWLGFAPNFFETSILRHPGYLVGAWNLHERGSRIIKTANGFAVGDIPLRCFGFHNVGGILDRAFHPFSPTEHMALHEVKALYRQELRWMDWTHLLPESWSYGRFVDGTPIPDAVRQKYRKSESLRRRFPNPFSVSAEEFQNEGEIR